MRRVTSHASSLLVVFPVSRGLHMRELHSAHPHVRAVITSERAEGVRERMNGGGAGKSSLRLRLQHYVLLAGVGALLVVACLRYAPAASNGVAWGVETAAGRASVSVASCTGEAACGAASESASFRRSPVVIFNFGDSNSDTGGMAAAQGMIFALPQGRLFFRRPTGRLTDGRLVIDFICERLKTPYLSPYLKALGSDFSNGVNFAIGGSTATPGGSPFSLDVQLHQFLFFRTRSMELLSRGERAPIDGEGFRRAIYAMDIGQNDLSAILHLPHDQVLAKIPAVVAHIRHVVEALYAHGARKFWIHGTGAIGCLPQKLSIPRDGDADIDGNGCLGTYNAAAKYFNHRLAETCSQLRQRMADAAIVFTDIFAIKYDLVANHTKYGIERPLMACCGNGGPPYNYNHFKMCMSGEMQLCDMDARFVSWDGIHLTEVANAIVADKVLTGEYSKPRIRITSLVNSTTPHAG